MNRLLAAMLLTFALSSSQTAQEAKNKLLVLPNPNLLRCKSSDCFQLWLDTPRQADAVFPKQLIVDMKQNCVYGMTATYDKSVRLADVKAAIDERYGKWAYTGNDDKPVKLWRVESEKFAIQLSIADKKDEKMNIAEVGTKQAIYIAFGGVTACNVP